MLKMEITYKVVTYGKMYFRFVNFGIVILAVDFKSLWWASWDECSLDSCLRWK